MLQSGPWDKGVGIHEEGRRRRPVGHLSAQKHKYEIPKKLLWCSAAFRVLLCSEREVFLFGKKETAVRNDDVRKEYYSTRRTGRICSCNSCTIGRTEKTT